MIFPYPLQTVHLNFGLQIDNLLNFKPQKCMLKQKLLQAVGIMAKLRSFFASICLLKVVLCLNVCPYLLYFSHG